MILLDKCQQCWLKKLKCPSSKATQIFFSRKISTLAYMPTGRLKSLRNEYINLIALRKAKIAYNFGLCECSRVKFNNALNNWVLLFSQVWLENLGKLPGLQPRSQQHQIPCLLNLDQRKVKRRPRGTNAPKIQ